MPLSKRKEVARFVHKKLLFRLRRLAVVFLLISTLFIYEISSGYIAGYLATAGFLTGVAIGWLAGRRMHTISWDAESKQAVTRMDQLGIAILIAYILFAISRNWIFAHWIRDNALSAFTLSVSAGGMLGRLYSTRLKIRQVLKKEGFLHRT